ncbi:flavin reductase [Pseudomonas sp. 14P_8.1_Bac3]|uniref:flavin reductase n=1 Tax=Pseudomonas sp. 14P_8.1_Bac3 TaxID=2971621 RepID=UPI0021C7D313|nr:flavin reductase [Pseudomonas sp. 14P_8.1_Bac3]MCU1758419.1 flavin reductase [Pseudomonas sp. 14P_8.1_Bac3]
MTTQTATQPGPTKAGPGFDGRALRDAFGSFATGVTIVTTVGPGGVDIGLTANSFSSVSLDPPMVLWSLARTSLNMDAFRNSGHFAVHILSADQEALSSRFASKGVDRFEGLVLDRGPDGVPLLPDCMARFTCKLAYQYEGGDHVIFVGEIVDFGHSARKPLVFHGGRYGMLLPKQTIAAVESADEFSNLSSDDLLYQVSNAYLRTRQSVIEKLESRQWTAEEYAVLSIIGREDGLCMPEIVARSEKVRGQGISATIIQKLIVRGLLHEVDSGNGQIAVRLTAEGRLSVLELIAIRKSSEADVQGNLDPSEVQVLKHLLARLDA